MNFLNKAARVAKVHNQVLSVSVHEAFMLLAEFVIITIHFPGPWLVNLRSVFFDSQVNIFLDICPIDLFVIEKESEQIRHCLLWV